MIGGILAVLLLTRWNQARLARASASIESVIATSSPARNEWAAPEAVPCSPTLRLGLYQQALEAEGYEWVVLPADKEIDGLCTRSIALVASNHIAEALTPAAACVSSLKRSGADVIVLGCTELPLAMPHSIRPEQDIPISDSIDALALAAMDWYSSNRT